MLRHRGPLSIGGFGGRVQETTLFVVGTVEQGVFSKWRSACTPLVIVREEGRCL